MCPPLTPSPGRPGEGWGEGLRLQHYSPISVGSDREPMSQPNKPTRLFVLAAVGFAIFVVVAVCVSRKFKHIPPPPIVSPATAPATQPATQSIVAVEPPRTYWELLHREFPKLATTQPIDQTLNMRDWGHFPITHPAYIDRRGVLWITRPDAEETDTLLTTASTRQVNLTRERVLFAHWFYNEGGDWIINLVTPAASGNGFEIVTS